MGLGVLMTALLTGAVADITGIVLATTLAATGLYVIPARRRQAKAEFSQKVADLRSRLREALTRQVHAAITRAPAKR
jgi:ABC-type transport system involved in cytochrome bd biosynthesis fused ATPase/permease subunit